MSRPSKIVRRIESEAGVPGLWEVLAHRIPACDLQSLLMEAFHSRAGRSHLPSLRNAASLFHPSAVDARRFAKFDRVAFASAPEFEAVDLSPITFFGTSHLLGGQSQNNILTTIRNAELLGDSTIAMALEAAKKRRNVPDVVRLCASHRVMRLQPLDFPGFTPHFRLFAMVSAGRDTGSSRFEEAELNAHVRAYLRLFEILNSCGFSIRSPLVEFADMRVVEKQLVQSGVSREDVRANIRAHWPGGTERFLSEHNIGLDGGSPWLEVLASRLSQEFPGARFQVNMARLEGLGYYTNFTVRISPLAPDGNRYPVGDGGFTDWTARLLNNRKERLLISGVGSEFLCKKYLV
ncbi:MAG: hypothetical protein IT167_28870 [Bryobacterales bacterium]|nr:hypothetical protein [Bryobacterales bacterium]